MNAVLQHLQVLVGKRFSKLWWLSICTMAAFWILVALGSWQVQRLNWKYELIERIESRVAASPTDLPLGTPLDLESWEYRLVTLNGLWLHDKEVHLYTGPKVMRGKPGYDIFTPLLIGKNNIVMVNRGWVPAVKKDVTLRPETVASRSAAKLVGMVHKAEQKARFTYDNDILKNVWFWIDVPAMLGPVQGHDGSMDHFYIRAVSHDKPFEGIYPIAGDTVVQYRNDHLQYAITWYSLAIILIIVYVALRKQLLGEV